MFSYALVLFCFLSFRLVLSVPNPNTLPTVHAGPIPATAQPHVLFAAHDSALLFINGQLKSRTRGWGQVGQVQHTPKHGDVISIYVSGGSSNSHGLIAAVYSGNPTHSVTYTGDEHWKAIALSKHTWKSLRHWYGKDGNSCRWPAPKGTFIRRLHQRELYSFPKSAQVVWAHTPNDKTAVLFRYVVGGEKCVNNFPTISFASKDIAWLYINGEFKGLVSHWNQIRRVHAKLAKGAVIALKVRGKTRQQGVAVDVALDAKKHILTGQPGWRAIRGHLKEHENPHGWMSGQYSSCHWPPAIALSKQPYLRNAQKEGARYVWRDRQGKEGTTLLRYVVGGEDCKHQTKIIVQSRPSSWVYINGRFVTFVKAGGREAVYSHLSKGDVIAVLSRGKRQMGVQIAMSGPQGSWYSGGVGWKGLMGRSPHDWKMKSYSSCGWRNAVVLMGNKKRHPTNGQLIWPSKNHLGISLLRFVVGGENCATIRFESPGPVNVYLNSRPLRASKIGHSTWFIRTSLKVGDIVGFAVRPHRADGKNWIRAVIQINGRFYPTGSSDWRVAQLPESPVWMDRKFDACQWSLGKYVSGWERLKGSAVRARAIWANEGALGLRFAVGGERCKPDQVPQVPDERTRKAMVSLSSDNEATLFVNGKVVLRVDSWRSVSKAIIHVEDGDVFGVLAKDGGLWSGLRVGLLVDGKEMGTGVGDWRIRDVHNAEKSWSSPGFEACHWPKPVKVDGGRRLETELPKINGPSHPVWTKETNIGDDVVARFALGVLC